MRHRAKIMILLFISFFLSFNVVHAANEQEMNVSIDEGFNGKIKAGKGFPLSIKLENKGESFSGDLVINFVPSWNAGGAMAINVELPANSTKTYQISLPGLSEDNSFSYQSEPMLHLYKNGLKKGKKVDFKGEKIIKPKYFDTNDSVIGVLSENYDRLKELRILPSKTMQMIELNKEEMPKQPLGLEMLDYLLIDEYGITKLDKEQQEAIIGWIEAGGILIAGAAPNANQSYGQLYSLLPMKIENETSATTDFFSAHTNVDPTFKQLPFFTGALDDTASIIERAGELPATVQKQYGNGLILQTSFSLGDEPLSSWKGYSEWFATLLKNANQPNAQIGKYEPNFYNSLYWEFVETNEYFPANHFSIGQLIGILIGYLIVLVPVLYFILRKFDKREHTWWIVPSLAFIMAAIVFSIGAKDRIAMPQLNQMGVYLANNNQLSGIQATTLLSNKGGEYTLTFPKEKFSAVTSTQNSGYGSSVIDPLDGAIFFEKREKMEVVFPKVDFWSLKSIYGKAWKDVKGEFSTNISVSNEKITGTIENQFDYDFEEVFILSGKEKIMLGPLKKGEQLKIDKQLKQSFLTIPAILGNSNSSYTNSDLNKIKMEKLDFIANKYIISQNHIINGPVIAGITKAPVIDVKIAGKKTKYNNLNLILLPFKAKDDFSGEFTIKNEVLRSQLNVINGRIYDIQNIEINREVRIENGEYEYILQLPKQLTEKSLKITELSFVFNNDNVKYTLYNDETGEYTPLNLDVNQLALKLDSDKNVNQFISKNGEIKFKLSKDGNQDQLVRLPSLTIKGEVAS